MDTAKQFDRIIEVAKSIELGKMTILTGNNGCGKSFLRKALYQFLEKKNNGKKVGVRDVSLSRRAGFQGTYNVFNSDCDWLPSSTQSFDWVKDAFEKCENYYIVLDEPEIGMSEEFQLALALYINQHKEEVLAKNLGILIISHSRQLVKTVAEDAFLNMEGMQTKDEWVNREIVPLNPFQLEKDCHELMSEIETHLKKA